MSPCIAALATNLIIFRYVSKLNYRLEKAAAPKITVSIMGTVSGTPLNSDLGQKISDSCLVLYTRYIKKMSAQVCILLIRNCNSVTNKLWHLHCFEGCYRERGEWEGNSYPLLSYLASKY